MYIVTKEKPRVMHASHIEDDSEDDVPYRQFQRTKTHADYDDDVLIRGIYKGDESHVYEQVDTDFDYTTTLAPQPQTETRKHKILPYAQMKGPNPRQKNNYMLQHDRVHHNMFTLYNQ